ncbi:DUF4194 domain-containing protein [Demequina aurantiaca]|uniref:DUF4194 domain-containing protein n=1 Tax=Demequina aurantiaca TaxID=676200 RepID=UPI003D349B67
MTVDEVGEDQAQGYFPGDTGTLKYDGRRVLRQLLGKTYISSESDSALWQALLENESDVRSALSDLMCELRVDRDREIAMKWQVPAEDGDLPSLIRPRQYTREEAAVMLIARDELLRARTGDTDDGQMRLEAWLDVEEIIDSVMAFPAVADNRPDLARARAVTAVESLRKLNVLVGRPDATRLKVSPVIEVLLPISKLEELARWLRPVAAPDMQNEIQGTRHDS